MKARVAVRDSGRLDLLAMPRKGKRWSVNYIRMIGKERISDAKARDADDLLARLVASAVERFRRILATVEVDPPPASIRSVR